MTSPSSKDELSKICGPSENLSLALAVLLIQHSSIGYRVNLGSTSIFTIKACI